jgi:hypothetical protein
MEYLSDFSVSNGSDTLHSPDFDRQHNTALFSALRQKYTAQEIQNTQHYWQPPQPMLTTPTPPPIYSSSQHFFTTPFVSQLEFRTTQSKSIFHEGNAFDFGRMITSDSDNQWTSFFRDSELFAGTMRGSVPDNVGNTTASV